MLYPTSCLFCLQGEGVGRAGAVATVMAAVDLARVRQPVHVEKSGAEEEPVVLQLQAATEAAETHVRMTAAKSAAVITTSEQHTSNISQVGRHPSQSFPDDSNEV